MLLIPTVQSSGILRHAPTYSLSVLYSPVTGARFTSARVLCALAGRSGTFKDETSASHNQKQRASGNLLVPWNSLGGQAPLMEKTAGWPCHKAEGPAS
jgi:hypothetical protein